MNEEIRDLLQRVDLNLPGAVEAVEAANASGAGAQEYRRIAHEFPVRFAGGFDPVSDDAHFAALSRLKKGIKNPDKATLAVRSGADVRSRAPAKMPWGNANLDYVTDGGIARARMIELKGAPQHGKTFAAQQAMARVLAMHGRGLWVALEPFDADWARTCGMSVLYAPEDAPEGSAEAAYNAAHPEGNGFTLLVGRTGNEVLQTVCNAIAINAWDLIVVDSLNVAVSKVHLENKGVGDYSPGGEANMHNQFSARAQTEWNGVAAFEGRAISKSFMCKTCGARVGHPDEHKRCEEMERQEAEQEAAAPKKRGRKAKLTPKFEESAVYGRAPRSALVVISQLRAQGIGGSAFVQPPPDSAGGHGFHHGKSTSVLFSGRAVLRAQAADKSTEAYGFVAQMKVDKNKAGVPERIGVFEIWNRTVEGLSRAGRYNLMTDLVGARLTFGSGDEAREKVFDGLAVKAGIVSQSGGYYYLGDETFHGLPAFQNFLHANPQVVQAIQAQLSAWIASGARCSG